MRAREVGIRFPGNWDLFGRRMIYCRLARNALLVRFILSDRAPIRRLASDSAVHRIGRFVTSMIPDLAECRRILSGAKTGSRTACTAGHSTCRDKTTIKIMQSIFSLASRPLTRESSRDLTRDGELKMYWTEPACAVGAMGIGRQRWSVAQHWLTSKSKHRSLQAVVDYGEA
jgi:hypothetical protein